MSREKDWRALADLVSLRVRRSFSGRRPVSASHIVYGATGIDPKHLVVWYLFATDADLKAAKLSGLQEDLATATRRELEAEGYPAEALPLIHVGCASEEDIQRETGGDAYQYFK